MHTESPGLAPRPDPAGRPGRAPTPATERILRTTILAFTLVGSLTGLVIGLVAYPPTALVAMLELGIPSAVLGVIVGSLIAAVCWCWSAVTHRRSHSRS